MTRTLSAHFLIAGLTLIALLALTAPLALPALADTGITFDGLKTDPAAPINVTADTLSVSQADSLATFSGNVVVTQSGMELHAATVKVIYNKQSKGIAELRASGGVTVKAGTNAAASDEAVYVVGTSGLVMTGHVILTMEQATIAGEMLTINLTTGLGTMTGGRVTTTFTPAKK